MIQNKYDDGVFFEKYSQMDRSVRGLAGAGEWPALKKLLPDLQGRRLLDLGCGFGWHCGYALARGAASAVGVDISEKMLAEGRRKFPEVQFIQGAIEDIDFPDGSFDLVLSSLALHYLESVDGLFKKVSRVLTPAGRFIFSVEHPVFTAQGPQDWCRDSAGGKQHWPVDDYFQAGSRRAFFLGEEMVKYHRPLSAYFAALRNSGFTVTDLMEPTPNEELLKTDPEMKDELRRPMMLILAAEL